ncbi:MAG TPA: anthranilate phosphoribosyltransferase [Bryobacteraceae bacterium]|nr:anthranilate phosphoribosyltransferase [Bryobacteraceae bacterium]
MSLLPYLEAVAEKQNLSAEQAREAMLVILGGQSSQPQLAAFLMAMRMKGETTDELVGFARAMREMAEPIDHGIRDGTLLDTCGTGGDHAGTFNISTIAAFVVAGAGVHVAKHGNRSVSNRSACGSADLLEGMGIEIMLPPAESARAIREVGIGFLFAPHVHTAMKHAAPVRSDLKMRTFFNLLGPLTNPAGASAQLAGVPSERAGELISGALAALGLAHGFVVHGSDGLDEITTTGATLVFEIRDGKVERRTVEPGDFAVHPASPEDLKGGDQARNLEIARQVLGGERGPHRDIVLVNAAAALVAAGAVDTFLEGMAIGTVSIDSGAARRKAADLAAFTKRLAA